MKKFLITLSTTVVLFFGITGIAKVLALNNPGDIGGSIIGSHESVNCMYATTSSSTVQVAISVIGDEPTGGSAGSTTVYGASLAGHADHCGGWWGLCSANGYCQPN